MWAKRLLLAAMAGCSQFRSRNRPESAPRGFIRLLSLDPMPSSKRSAPWWTRSSDGVAHEGRFRVDCVEERGDRHGAGAAPGFEPERVIGFPPSGGGDRLWSGDELGQFAQVLGDGGEVEFVVGAERTA
jgi:hypothetical protein